MHRSKVVLPVLLITIFLTAWQSSASAEGLEESSAQIRTAMDARDYSRAEALVRELRGSNEKSYFSNNYDYLLGRLCERRGLYSEATALYLGSLNRKSVLSGYALWHLSAVVRASGDLDLERQYLTRLLASEPGSALLHDARERMVRSLLESGQYRGAIAMLRPAASASGTGRASLAMLGQAYLRVGDLAAAREAFSQLESGSRDDYALSAALGLDALDQAANTKPGEFECVRRANIYLENRHWAEARRSFMEIVNGFPQSTNRPDALYQIGFCFYREENNDDAVKWFDQAHTEFPDKKQGEQGYYWVGTALQKARQYDQAVKRYSDFIAAYPNSDLLPRAYLNIVDCYRYSRKDVEALEWAADLEHRFTGQPMATTGLFDQAKVELSRSDYAGALSLLNRLRAYAAGRQLGAPGSGEVEFLRAFATEQAGQISQAVSLYLAMPDVRDDYFGHRATLRLQALAASNKGAQVIDGLRRASLSQSHLALASGRYQEAKDAANRALRLTASESGRVEIFEILRACYSRLPAYSEVYGYRLTPIGRPLIETGEAGTDRSPAAMASELLFLGLYDEGMTELRLGGGSVASLRTTYAAKNAVKLKDAPAAKEAVGNPSFSMAVYNNRGDHAHSAISYAEPLFKSIPRDYQLALLPRDLAELLYPAPYRDSLNRYGSSLGIDPRIVLSLARQESRFNPRAKSNASARGLLQFIPETALKLAGEEGLNNFQLDDVYAPDVALRLASRYVADLAKLFPDNPYAIAASYDTGEQNVERWIFRARSPDVDAFVAEIMIPETKDYVAKVLSNYWAYCQLYTTDLNPKQ